MTDKAENQSAPQGAGEGSTSQTDSARSQCEAFEHLCEEIRSAMAGCRPWPQYCMPPEHCMPPFGHHPHHHHCGPPPYYCGPPPPLSLLNHMFQFAGARAHFWHRWFESLAGTGYRPSWHDSYCYDPRYPKYDPCYPKYDPCCSTYDPCCSMPEVPDCEEFKDIKCAIKDFLGQLSDDQRKKYEPVLCEMIHCVLMMRRMDTMRRKPHPQQKYASAGSGWH